MEVGHIETERDNIYKNAKIYKIVSLNNTDLTYYGATCSTLTKRLNQHKTKLNTSARILFEAGNTQIILVENYECKTKEELNAREAFYILNNPCVNRVVPGQSKTDNTIRNEKRKLTVSCECGSIIRHDDMAEHKRSKKHLIFLTK